MNECVWKVEWDTLYKVKWHAWKSVVVSAICFAVVCWGTAGNIISARNASRINKLIHMTGTITGQNFEAFVRDRRWGTVCHKLLSIREHPAHPLQPTLLRWRSSFPLRLIQACFRKSILLFTPSIIHLSENKNTSQAHDFPRISVFSLSQYKARTVQLWPIYFNFVVNLLLIKVEKWHIRTSPFTIVISKPKVAFFCRSIDLLGLIVCRNHYLANLSYVC